MLPSADELLAAWPFIARRYGLAQLPSRPAVDAALRLAQEHATGPEDAPAALFFALASYPRAFPGAWALASRLFASGLAASLGFRLDATEDELSTLRLEIAQRRADCEAVKAWFRVRLAPV